MSVNAPQEITYHKQTRVLDVAWSEQRYELPAELLRVYSPSAEVRGHSAEERKLQQGKKNVAITQIEAVGNYAIRLVFDDGHDTGIYAWDFLPRPGRTTRALLARLPGRAQSCKCLSPPTHTCWTMASSGLTTRHQQAEHFLYGLQCTERYTRP